MRFTPQIQPSSRVKLDVKDRKILSILARNARMPAAAIAREVGLSKDTVNYRIKAYEKKGLIQGYRAVINIERFGLSNYHLFLTLSKPLPDEGKTLAQKLATLSYIRTVIQYTGAFDFELAVVAADVMELEVIIAEVGKVCGKLLERVEVLAVTEEMRTGPFPDDFLKAGEPEAISPKKITEYSLDGKDFAILRHLAGNARKTLLAIAGETGYSIDMVRYRIERMQKGGYLRAFVPALNYQMMGYNIYCILITIRGLDEFAKLREAFRSDPHTMWAVRCVGSFHAIAYVAASDVSCIHETASRLAQAFPDRIIRHEMLIAKEQFSYIYLPDRLFNH